jgi:hypothetical protein
MQGFQYKIGFSLKEFNQISGKEFTSAEVENLLSQNEFGYKKVIVGDVLRETIPVCMDAVYKKPSSMRTDAPGAFSCSSFISYLYTQAGVWMPSLSIDKYVFGLPVPKEDLKFGDLIFSNTGEGLIRTETAEYKPGTKVPEGIDHVGMFLEDNKVLHASKTIGKVGIEKITESENFRNIIGYKRMADIGEKRFVVLIPDGKKDLRNKEDFIKNIINKSWQVV